jgi:hypothetical protein
VILVVQYLQMVQHLRRLLEVLRYQRDQARQAVQQFLVVQESLYFLANQQDLCHLLVLHHPELQPVRQVLLDRSVRESQGYRLDLASLADLAFQGFLLHLDLL